MHLWEPLIVLELLVLQRLERLCRDKGGPNSTAMQTRGHLKLVIGARTANSPLSRS
jgi:hypothetical protein